MPARLSALGLGLIFLSLYAMALLRGRIATKLARKPAYACVSSGPTRETLDDLAEILAHCYAESGTRTAEMVERRIVEQIETLPPFPERIRKSARIPGARELVVSRQVHAQTSRRSARS